jgi:hypothetical protein
MTPAKAIGLINDLRKLCRTAREEAVRGDVQASESVKATVLISFTIEACTGALMRTLAK